MHVGHSGYIRIRARFARGETAHRTGALSLLDEGSHRPWPLPEGPWVMAQTWHEVLFAHWPVPAEALQALIPAPLEMETYRGKAWIGVVPFRMTGVRPRSFPAVPGLSAFPELNVRSYVRLDDKPGVFFFSLDAGNRVAVELARRWFHLPYFHARMSLGAAGEWVRYASRRVHRGEPPAEFLGRFRPTGEVFRAISGTLEHWLTERYCLYAADSERRIYRGEIHHRPWPLQAAEAAIEVNSMTAPLGLCLPDTPPLLHFARRLEVAVWPPRLASG